MSASSAQLFVKNTFDTIARINGPKLRGLIREYMPYAVIRRDDGKHILLNRNYKPLGMPSRGNHYDYDSDDFLMVSTGIHDIDLEALFTTPVSPGVKFFYDDSSPPWSDPAAFKAYRETVFRALRLWEAA